MKRLIACFFLLSLTFAGAGCSKSETPMTKTKKQKKMQQAKKASKGSEQAKGETIRAQNQKKYGVFTEACKTEISAKCPAEMEKRNTCVKTNLSTFSPDCTKQFLAAELKKRRR